MPTALVARTTAADQPESRARSGLANPKSDLIRTRGSRLEPGEPF